MMRSSFYAALVAGCLAISAGVASAADTAKAPTDTSKSTVDATKINSDLGPEGVWSSHCDIDRMTDAKTCRMMIYRTIDEGSGRDPGFIALSIIPTGNDYHLILTSNQGLLQSCALRVDRQPRIETYIATLNMCMFPNFLSGRVNDQFRNGVSLLVRVNSAHSGRRDLDFSLNGFGRNFDDMQKALQ